MQEAKLSGSAVFAAIILYSFDSIVKFDLGFAKMHPSILVLTFLAVFFFTFKSVNFEIYIKRNLFFIGYILFSVFSFFSAVSDTAFIKNISYPVIVFLSGYAIYCAVGNFRSDVAFFFLLVFTIIFGYVQWLLYKAFGYQLTLLELTTDYYVAGGSIEGRMRGFFLEPNWFGVSVLTSFVAFDIAKRDDFSKTVYGYIFFFTLLALILADNRIILFLFMVYAVFLYFAPILKNDTANFIAFIVFVFLFIGLAIVMTLSDVLYSDRSLAARGFTLFNVVNFFSELDLRAMFFGVGFSNWAVYSNDYGLSAMNYLQDQGDASRDTSEFYVILLEQGFLGLALLCFDSLQKCWLIHKSNINGKHRYTFIILAVPLISMVYPVFTFLPYLIGYIFLRVLVDLELVRA